MAATPLSIPTSGRWPLTELLAASGMSRNGLARQLRLAGHTLRTASRRGLSDVQADRWAVRLGLHPVEVWGSSWYDSVGDRGGPSHARVARHLRSLIERGELARAIRCLPRTRWPPTWGWAWERSPRPWPTCGRRAW